MLPLKTEKRIINEIVWKVFCNYINALFNFYHMLVLSLTKCTFLFSAINFVLYESLEFNFSYMLSDPNSLEPQCLFSPKTRETKSFIDTERLNWISNPGKQLLDPHISRVICNYVYVFCMYKICTVCVCCFIHDIHENRKRSNVTTGRLQGDVLEWTCRTCHVVTLRVKCQYTLATVLGTHVQLKVKVKSNTASLPCRIITFLDVLTNTDTLLPCKSWICVTAAA